MRDFARSCFASLFLLLPFCGSAHAAPTILVTTAEVAKRYFDSITAPQKEYALLPNTGHDPNAAMIDAQYNILKKRVVPLMK